MTDNERKGKIRQQREEIRQLRYDLARLTTENEQLKKRIAILEQSHKAKMSEMDCEAYNL